MISAADYYADKIAPVPSLNASIAKLLISRSPLHAWIASPRLNPNWQPEEDQKFDIGSAAHALLLEGEDRMVVVDAADWRSNAAKAARDLARQEGKHPVLKHQHANVVAMVEAAMKAFAQNEDLSGYTISGSGGESEHTVVWHEGETYFRARLDRVSTDRKLIVDYKSTECAEPETWLRTMLNMGGDIQAAFYLLAMQRPDTKFVFMVQETEPPHATSFIGMSPALVELGMRKVARAIDIWRECMASDRWPSYSSRILYLEPPAWSVSNWEEREIGWALEK